MYGNFWVRVLPQNRVTHSTISGIEENLTLYADKKLHKTMKVQSIVQYDSQPACVMAMKVLNGGTLLIDILYTGCFTTLGHNCRR